MKKLLLALLLVASACTNPDTRDGKALLDSFNGSSDNLLKSYIEQFNAADDEIYSFTHPNDTAYEFLSGNVPYFTCPDKELEKTYYFRWWTFRKHVRETPMGYIVTEFLPDVPWAGKYNSINCPANHHFNEGRWIKNPEYLDNYARFWMAKDGGSAHVYTFAAATAVYDFYKVHNDTQLLADLYPALKENFSEWINKRRDETGLFWQIDGYDGMEVSASGSLAPDNSGYRATINTFMYGNLKSLASIAEILGQKDDAADYQKQAEELKSLINGKLWDAEAHFYKVIPRNGKNELSPYREEHGFTPWLFDIPLDEYSDAWRQLTDSAGFAAPFGPTTLERRSPAFELTYTGHECKWNGPSWPYSTTITLKALSNYIHTYPSKVLDKNDFYALLSTFSNAHRLEDKCWIDENINPLTGYWMSRTMLIERGSYIKERGKDYNHSSFCDLIISDLVGIRPQPGRKVSIEPLIPASWSSYSLTNVHYHNHCIDIVYDAAKGYFIYLDGKIAHSSRNVEDCTIRL